MKRELYIDAMRGLAMSLVILSHVIERSFHSSNIIFSVIQLELPLFFFISGFFADKMTRRSFKYNLSDKAKRLLIPSLLMLACYCWVMDLDYIVSICARYKSGYWFPMVLFAFVIVFLTTEKIYGCLKLSERFKWIVHLSVGCIFIFIATYSEKYAPIYPSVINTFSVGEFKYYIFFVLGNTLFLRKEKLFDFMSKREWAMASVIILFFVLTVIRFRYGFAPLKSFATLPMTLSASLGLITIWILFNSHKNIFKEQHNGGGYLCLVGRRSIDVYFLHYFLLPKNMSFVGEFFSSFDMPFVEFCLAILLSLLLIGGSLVMGQVLRLSSFVAQWFLGEKRV